MIYLESRVHEQDEPGLVTLQPGSFAYLCIDDRHLHAANSNEVGCPATVTPLHVSGDPPVPAEADA